PRRARTAEPDHRRRRHGLLQRLGGLQQPPAGPLPKAPPGPRRSGSGGFNFLPLDPCPSRREMSSLFAEGPLIDAAHATEDARAGMSAGLATDGRRTPSPSAPA